ncbi:hypothetical protein [Labilibaculum antarcticum]|nr:hypothetical protein [Labilibaculum antarcticum]
MKRPCQSDFDIQEDDSCSMVSSPDKFGTGYMATKKQILNL